MFVPWLADQALLSRLTGLEPEDMLPNLRYPLILLSLAAIYRLGRSVTRRRQAATLVVLVWGFYLLTSARNDLARSFAGFDMAAS